MAKRKKTKKLTPKEKEKRAHWNRIRKILRESGFERDTKPLGNFTFKDQGGEFDDFFIFENVLLCMEYTTENPVGTHLKKKKLIYDTIESHEVEFLELLSEREFFKNTIFKNYEIEEIQFRIVYCSLNEVQSSHRKGIDYPKYFGDHETRYFQALTSSLKLSARHELLHFLEIEESKVGYAGLISQSSGSEAHKGLLLPASISGYGKDLRVVSFYISALELLSYSYVFRKSGWRDISGGYQRLVSPAKIKGVRKHIETQKKVFPTNIVASLPSSTKFFGCDEVGEKGTELNPAALSELMHVYVDFKREANCIGLIDGQHRVYGYHESKDESPAMAKERGKRNLLVTGIMYPESWDSIKRTQFEAQLFLQINTKQTKVPSDITLGVELVTEPFADRSIATKVLFELNRSSGPLELKFQQFFYETTKLKTSSVIQFGLTKLVKISVDGTTKSLFDYWKHPEKETLITNPTKSLLGIYTHFCVEEINKLALALKLELGSDRWTTDKKKNKYFLNATNMTAMMALLRIFCENGKLGSQNYYSSRLSGFKSFNYGDYKSSQYNKMANAIYSKFF